MITLTLHRSDLVAARACEDGLALYDAIAAECPPVRVRLRSGRVVERRDRIRVRWTPLAQLWLAREHPLWSAWLFETGLASRVSLTRANLRGADLGGADLGSADLGGANLRGANLRGADLGSAYLRGADLGGADLGRADLGSADLGGANLRGADLGSAYLGSANLRGADLGSANLRGAWRDADDPAVNGWRVVEGRMVRS